MSVFIPFLPLVCKFRTFGQNAPRILPISEDSLFEYRVSKIMIYSESVIFEHHKEYNDLLGIGYSRGFHFLFLCPKELASEMILSILSLFTAFYNS